MNKNIKIVFLVAMCFLIAGLGWLFFENKKNDAQLLEQQATDAAISQEQTRKDFETSQQVLEKVQLSIEYGVPPTKKVEIYENLCGKKLDPQFLELAMNDYFFDYGISEEQIVSAYQADEYSLDLIEQEWGITAEEFCSLE